MNTTQYDVDLRYSEAELHALFRQGHAEIECDEGFSPDDLLHELAILEQKALGYLKHGRESGRHAI